MEQGNITKICIAASPDFCYHSILIVRNCKIVATRVETVETVPKFNFAAPYEARLNDNKNRSIFHISDTLVVLRHLQLHLFI